MTQPMSVAALSTGPDSRSKPISSRGGLRFLYRLGQGGMAEVHVASCSSGGSDPGLVVVKRMHQQHLEDAATVRMFLDEARLAIRLVHPNIVRTERLGMFDGRHGIVMEFLQGQPLHQVLRRAYEVEASLDLDVIVQIAIAALDGLHYAHELKDAAGNRLGVVHRDVSPQNLFLTYDGAVKLLDFGIAKNALSDVRTRTGLLKGKIAYMAPEQARGEELDRRADLWSLGVVIWEAVTGNRLFRGVNEAATLNLTLTEDVPAPSTRRADLPPELESILMRALERDPEARYATASEMREALEAWLDARDLGAEASISLLMQRLFGAELRAERERLAHHLSAAPDPIGESGLTLVASSFGVPTSSGLRATQISSVTDLMTEIARQRRTTTRLLSGLLLLVAAGAATALLLLARSLEAPPTAGAAVAAATATAKLAPVAAGAPTTAAPPNHAAQGSGAAATGNKPLSPAPPAAVRLQRSAPSPSTARALAELPTSGPIALPPAAAETGLLNLDTSPWSFVSTNGKSLGQTPLIGATLPAGTHVLVLSNPELGLRTTYPVTITPGRTTARRIGLE